MFRNRSIQIKLVKDDPEGEFKEVNLNNEVVGHFERHKKLYLIGSYVMVMGVTYVLMRGRHQTINVNLFLRD